MKGRSLSAALVRLGLAAVLLGISALVLWLRSGGTAPEEYDIQVFAPGCVENGYSIHTNRQTGESFVADTVPALGHSFDDWKQTEAPSLLTAGRQSRACTRCGLAEEALLFLELPVPVLDLQGSTEGIAKKVEVPMEARLLGLESPVTVKHQGHSSLSAPKKNYTIKFWQDEARQVKNKLTFSHWNEENKYVLKADYLDPTMCRNLVCADVWAAVTASREGLPEGFRQLSNCGAVDGFPVALYINGQLEGLYNLNLHKDDDLFGFSDGEEQAILICNEPEGLSAQFREVATFSGDCPWEVEFCGTEDPAWAKEKLNGLIRFVLESDDAAFRQNLGRYLDVSSALDYLLCLYALGLTNHGTDELVLVCDGEDSPWVASLYDMETGFGLSADGMSYLPPESFLPTLADGTWDSGTGNLLWDRLLQNFYPELCARYAQLRQQLLEPQALQGRVTAFCGAIGEALLEANQVFHSGLPEYSASLDQINQYIQDRIPLLDEVFRINEG